MVWNVYLSGEIHTNWRSVVTELAFQKKLPVEFFSPVTNHELSDDCGAIILGKEESKFWHDHKGAKLNTIRNKTRIEKADIVVVRFGEKYKQWNAAFDAGYAAALSKPIIVIRLNEHQHALKEIDAAALATVQTPEQTVQILQYVINGTT
tara:strand:- start:255 stop:704 length:450 start_codon:yes stop_codon:yes gene_type:complete